MTRTKRYSLTRPVPRRPPRARRPGRLVASRCRDDGAQPLERDRAGPQHSRPGARDVDDRRGHAARSPGRRRGRPDRVAELLLGLVAGRRGRLPGPVGAGDRHRAGAVQQGEGGAVQRHPHGDRAAGVAEVPVQGGLGPADDGQPARPEGVDQVPRVRRARRWPARRAPAGWPPGPAAASSRPRPLAASSARTAARSKASAPTPYTVSVGSTTTSPRRTASAASRTPSSRPGASRTSMRRLTPGILARSAQAPCAGRCGRDGEAAGQAAVSDKVLPSGSWNHTIRAPPGAVQTPASSCSIPS